MTWPPAPIEDSQPTCERRATFTKSRTRDFMLGLLSGVVLSRILFFAGAIGVRMLAGSRYTWYCILVVEALIAMGGFVILLRYRWLGIGARVGGSLLPFVLPIIAIVQQLVTH